VELPGNDVGQRRRIPSVLRWMEEPPSARDGKRGSVAPRQKGGGPSRFDDGGRFGHAGTSTAPGLHVLDPAVRWSTGRRPLQRLPT
jgi:hypothetical protein